MNKWKNAITGFYKKFSESADHLLIKKLIDVAVISAIVGISFYILGANLDAHWWIIDDHEIVSFIGPDHAFGFKEIIPTLLTKTEINPDSTLGRFRPAYYFLRLIETRLWIHNAPMDWYLARIFIFIFFIITFYLFFRKINGQIVGALLAIYCTTSPFWTDIFARLGPSETYAVLGVGFFICGYLLLESRIAGILAWILLTFGVLVSIGSKENLIILLLPYVFIFFRYILTSNKHKIMVWISASLCLVWTGWIYINLFFRLKKTGTDIYSNSVSFSERIAKLGSYISGNRIVFGSLIVLFAIGLLVLLLWKNQKAKAPAWGLLVGSGFTILLIVSQVFFYLDQFEGRYFFPLFLFLPLTISLFIYLFQQYALLKINRPLYYSFTLLAIIGLVLAIQPENWLTMHNASLANVHLTHVFADKVSQIADYLKINPEMDVVFYGTNPGLDYEPIDSYEQFLRANGVSNQFFILRDPSGDYQTSDSKLALRLEEDLMDKSKNGDPSWNISPINALTNDPQNCLLITLKFDHPSPRSCQKVIDGDVLLNFKGLYQ